MPIRDASTSQAIAGDDYGTSAAAYPKLLAPIAPTTGGGSLDMAKTLTSILIERCDKTILPMKTPASEKRCVSAPIFADGFCPNNFRLPNKCFSTSSANRVSGAS